VKKTLNILQTSAQLKWLAKAILVLGLFAFSAPVSDIRTNDHLAQKTELSEVRRISSKRIIRLEKVAQGITCSFLWTPIRTENFTPVLLHQQARITVALRRNFKDGPTREQSAFLLYHAADRTEEPDAHAAQG